MGLLGQSLGVECIVSYFGYIIKWHDLDLLWIWVWKRLVKGFLDFLQLTTQTATSFAEDSY